MLQNIKLNYLYILFHFFFLSINTNILTYTKKVLKNQPSTNNTLSKFNHLTLNLI